MHFQLLLLKWGYTTHPYLAIQVREENPILYSHKTQLNIKLSLLQHYNMFRPKLSAIFRLYMKPI